MGNFYLVYGYEINEEDFFTAIGWSNEEDMMHENANILYNYIEEIGLSDYIIDYDYIGSVGEKWYFGYITNYSCTINDVYDGLKEAIEITLWNNFLVDKDFFINIINNSIPKLYVVDRDW